MKYFATFDANGNVTGHHVDEVHGDSIPKEAIVLTQKQHEMSCQGNLIRDIKNRKWIEKPKPSIMETLNLSKQNKLEEINQLRTKNIGSGVTYKTKTFDTDETSYSNLTETLLIINSGIPLPENFTWRTKDNYNVPADKNFIMGLAGVMMTHKNDCYSKSWQLKEQVEKAKTVAEVEKIVWK